jgi:hypothetical protein
MSKQRCEPVSSYIHLFCTPFTWLWCVCFRANNSHLLRVPLRLYFNVSDSLRLGHHARPGRRHAHYLCRLESASRRARFPSPQHEIVHRGRAYHARQRRSGGVVAASARVGIGYGWCAGVCVCVDGLAPLSICLSHRVYISLGVCREEQMPLPAPPQDQLLTIN